MFENAVNVLGAGGVNVIGVITLTALIVWIARKLFSYFKHG